ncbi:hypothetical protein [uncultured Mediterranean phage uvMED]|nr:hypothetical protein [uncultured Mediterranean phage uvMED]
MKFNNEILKYIVFSIMAVATLLLIYLEANAVGFKTQTLRQMWYACYSTSMNTEPHVPPPIHSFMCDCVVDKGRMFYTTEETYYQSTDNKTIVWSNFVNDCKFEMMQMTKGFEST